MSAPTDLVTDLGTVIERLVPRLLSQVCRDPGSPAYGACDRDWWHYKIRDFPSIILQQAGYTAWLAGRLPAWTGQGAELDPLAAAAARFWNERARRRGAFEEYYPFEQGYPPLAFSTLAVMKLAAADVVGPGDVAGGAAVAARQLLERFESQAANQQVAGLAALAWLRRVFPERVPEAEFARVRERTLALQTGEGWFEEYGGPDLGYLSVTLDCLWDAFDATGDRRYVEAAARGLDCIARYVLPLGGGIGMHNARNTDYILPYGLARFATGTDAQRVPAQRLLRTLYGRVREPAHFVWAIDDRYVAHYAGHSLIRAWQTLANAPAGLPEDAAPAAATDVLLDGAGHYLRAGQPGEGYALIVSLRKGGIFSAGAGERSVADYGWVVEADDGPFVTHWWSAAWQWEREGHVLLVRGRLVPCREHLSSPLKHAVLRGLSALCGRRLIAPLKNRLIFRKAGNGPWFERRLTLAPDAITVDDHITGLTPAARVRPAPRTSKRHVASADSFHREDLALTRGVREERQTQFAHGIFTAKTVYRLA
jgi:hypothetical protein